MKKTAPAASAAQAVLTPAQCAGKGLAPLALTLAVPAGMTARVFPEAGVHLRLSGPPGAPLGLEIRPGAATLEADARALAGGPPEAVSGPVRVAGASRPALSLITGASHARRQVLLFRAGPGDAVLFAVHAPAGSTSAAAEPAVLAALPGVAPILNAIQLE